MFLMLGDVVYNAEFPSCAPDIVFGAEDEHFHPFRFSGRAQKNSLTDWNYKDPSRLCLLIQELR